MTAKIPDTASLSSSNWYADFVCGVFFFISKVSLKHVLLCLSYSYSLTGGYGQFSINPATGQIITSSLLDREDRANYQLLVVATDGGQPEGLSSSATVSVTVADINDNPPRFHHHPYVTHIPASTAAGEHMH